jgi:excisionase family DNA binding protein
MSKNRAVAAQPLLDLGHHRQMKRDVLWRSWSHGQSLKSRPTLTWLIAKLSFFATCVGKTVNRTKSPDIAEYPLTVKQAAEYLGVSPQLLYLWVERKQIPHLRVMGRNIRFLKSELESFRNSFKQEVVEHGKTD